MKVVLPKHLQTDQRYLKLATLERPQPSTDLKDELDAREYKLRHTPSDRYSTTYNVTVAPLREPNSEQFIRFTEKIQEILKGLNQSAPDDKKLLIEQLLGETEKTAFRSGFKDDGTFTEEDFQNGLEALKLSIFPSKAAIHQKRLLRSLRKPREMNFRAYSAQMMEINNMLETLSIHPWQTYRGLSG